MDEETGAVVGIVLGARMDSTRIDGMRGWGVPSETVMEVSSRCILLLLRESSRERKKILIHIHRCSACRDWRASSE